MKNLPRLIAVSGKGGVGKTLYSLANLLKHQEKNRVKYLNFECDRPPISLPIENFIKLNLQDSTTEYISRKLNSNTIASWVTKAKFFKALYGMLPGLSQMIILGHILDILEQDPKLTIILDCPASGHFLSILNVPTQFKSIFGVGAIVKDIERMQNLLSNPDFFSIKLLTIPTELSIKETYDTAKKISLLNLPKPQIILNNTFSKTIEKNNQTPLYFQQKIKQEEEFCSKNSFDSIIPHIIAKNNQELLEKLKVVI